VRLGCACHLAAELGLTIGVATLVTVMTIVQGGESPFRTEIANLGTNRFQIAGTPFAVTDFNIIVNALKYKKIDVMMHGQGLSG